MAALPQAFLDEVRAQLGDEFPSFLVCFAGEHAAALRLNPLRAGAERLSEAFSDGPVPWEPFGRYVRPGARPGLSLAHYGGAYYLQEASAMLAAAALDARPGMRVLDLCAAPGGKSGQILRQLDGRGLLVSNEPDAARARMLAGNLERLGAANAAVTNEFPDRLARAFPQFFDAVLVDAPCSGEGMFRRDPAAIGEWNPELPAFCHRRQLEILDGAARMLRPGGRMVYSTCTFNRLENEETVRAFLDAHPDFSPEDFQLPGADASSGGMLRAWPHRLRGEGHFVCRMRRDDAETRRRPPAGRGDAEPKEARAALDALRITALADALPAFLEDRRLVLRGGALWALCRELPPMDGLRSPMPGLALCRVGRSHVEPEHALAMALRPDQAARTIALDDAAGWRYLAGEALPSGGAGWTLATWNGIPLGWGKASDGLLKNHLPKGLRRPQGAPSDAGGGTP